jgi:ABC-type antimicrobial peptide transport system permease subunit
MTIKPKSVCIGSDKNGTYDFFNLSIVAYRTNISWWIFIIAAFAAVLIAMITVSFQAIKAAIANPVKSLRTE